MNKNFGNVIEINKNEVFRYLEYNNQHIDEKLYNIIDDYIKIAKDKIIISSKSVIVIEENKVIYQNKSYLKYLNYNTCKYKKEVTNYEYSGVYKK